MRPTRVVIGRKRLFRKSKWQTWVEVVGSSGFADLDEAAVRAARAARFTPARSGDRSVASTARLKLAFRLK